MNDVAFEIFNKVMANMAPTQWIENHPDGEHVAEYLIIDMRVLVSWDLSGDKVQLKKIAIVPD